MKRFTLTFAATVTLAWVNGCSSLHSSLEKNVSAKIYPGESDSAVMATLGRPTEILISTTDPAQETWIYRYRNEVCRIVLRSGQVQEQSCKTFAK